jgi:hypothetical protein
MNELSAKLAKLVVDTIEIGQERQRKHFLEFVRKRENFEELQSWLSTSKKYLSREDRNLLIRIVRYEKVRRHLLDDVDGLIRVFQSLKYIPVDARLVMKSILSTFLSECKDNLDDPRPTTDEERFDLILDGLTVTKSALQQLRQLGVFSCGVRYGHRQLELMGTSPAEEFYRKTTEVWGFETPEKYFLYG